MSHVQHELHAEFPDSQDILHKLKISDAHFVRLSDSYHEINREIHRIEAEVEPSSDEHLETLKKQRLALLDDISQIVQKAGATT